MSPNTAVSLCGLRCWNRPLQALALALFTLIKAQTHQRSGTASNLTSVSMWTLGFWTGNFPVSLQDVPVCFILCLHPERQKSTPARRTKRRNAQKKVLFLLSSSTWDGTSATSTGLDLFHKSREQLKLTSCPFLDSCCCLPSSYSSRLSISGRGDFRHASQACGVWLNSFQSRLGEKWKPFTLFFFFTPRGLQCCSELLFIEKITSSSNKTPTSAAALLITLASAWLAIASSVSLRSSSGDLKDSLQQSLPGCDETSWDR